MLQRLWTRFRAVVGCAPKGRVTATAPVAMQLPPECAYVLETGHLSDPGCVRRRNEDSILVLRPKLGRNRGGSLLAVVADGMGGHQAGDRASQLAVAAIGQIVELSDLPPEAALGEAFQAANRTIVNEASDDSELAGMGTTATALLVVDGRASLAHVGDSRLYRLRGDRLEQLSEDHTWVRAMLRDGLITPEQAARHPNRHVLVRAMGTHPQLEVMQAPVSLALGDVFLLCSDGLHDLVGDEDIRTCLLTRPPQAACAFLVELARQRGGFDNVSVIVVRCAGPGETPAGSPQTRDAVRNDHD